MINEFEIVPHSNIKHVNCFIVDIAYRLRIGTAILNLT